MIHVTIGNYDSETKKTIAQWVQENNPSEVECQIWTFTPNFNSKGKVFAFSNNEYANKFITQFKELITRY